MFAGADPLVWLSRELDMHMTASAPVRSRFDTARGPRPRRGGAVLASARRGVASVAAAAAEVRGRLIEQANAEYEAYTAGKLFRRVGKSRAPGGDVEYCGDEDDPTLWTVAYVRARDNALVPLTCGDRERAIGEFRRIDCSDVAFWTDYDCPPPALLVNGVRYLFQPARGRVLLGVVELVGRAVLLVADGTRLVAIHRAGGVHTVLPLGRPTMLREVDLDHLLAYFGPRGASQRRPLDEPLRPSPRTRAQHLRIVYGRPVDLGAGPRLSEVLAAIFEDIEIRATTPMDRARGQRLKGKSWVSLVLRYLRKLCVLGCRDLVGLTGQIIAQIQSRFPEFSISAEAFADALKLIAATRTGLIAPRKSGDRIWRIRLAALADPTSALHRRLCSETTGRPGVGEAANQSPSDPRERPPGASPRAPAEHASPTPGAQVDPGQAPADTPANVHGPTPAPLADAEAPAAASSSVPPDPTRASREAEALRVVEQFRHIPMVGPRLLLWTQGYFLRNLSPAGPVAANVAEPTRSSAANGGGESVQEVAPSPVGGLDVPDETGTRQDAQSDSSAEPRPEDGEVEAPLVARTPLVAGTTRERPARHSRRPARARKILRRAARRAAELGTLGPRGPPVTRSG